MPRVPRVPGAKDEKDPKEVSVGGAARRLRKNKGGKIRGSFMLV